MVYSMNKVPIAEQIAALWQLSSAVLTHMREGSNASHALCDRRGARGASRQHSIEGRGMTWITLLCLLASLPAVFFLYVLAFTLGDYVVLRRALREITTLGDTHHSFTAARIARVALTGRRGEE
jgi:hypothetical protein